MDEANDLRCIGCHEFAFFLEHLGDNAGERCTDSTALKLYLRSLVFDRPQRQLFFGSLQVRLGNRQGCLVAAMTGCLQFDGCFRSTQLSQRIALSLLNFKQDMVQITIELCQRLTLLYAVSRRHKQSHHDARL